MQETGALCPGISKGEYGVAGGGGAAARPQPFRTRVRGVGPWWFLRGQTPGGFFTGADPCWFLRGQTPGGFFLRGQAPAGFYGVRTFVI